MASALLKISGQKVQVIGHTDSVLGLGPDAPVADNAAAEGRARNRRIAFRVL